MAQMRNIANLLFAGTFAGLAAVAASAQEMRGSEETASIILGPLAEELGLRGEQARDRRAPPEALAAPGSFDSDFSGASRFAAAALTARSGREFQPFAVFTERTATLAELSGGARISMSLFDGARPNSALLAFNPDYAELAGLQLGAPEDRPRQVALNYETTIDAPGALDGLDLGVMPRASVSVGELGSAANAGAVFRIGQYVQEMERRPRWWFFAGADREALLYDPSAGFTLRRSFALEDYAMIGDAQAGVAVRFAGADISLAYVQRETVYSSRTYSFETVDDFAAFSLTWRR